MSIYQTDNELVNKLIEGSSKAFDDLYERYKRQIYGYCLRLLQDEEGAKDAVQNTFLSMFQNIAKLNNPETLKAWLFTIARNEVFMIMRRKKMDGLAEEDV